MSPRRAVVVAALVVLAVTACSAERAPEAEPGSEALVTDLPERCSGLGRVPARGQVTFVADGRAYAATANGRRVRCIADAVESAPMSWGAAGDRFLLGSSGNPDLYLAGSREAIAEPSPDSALQGLSRPEGTQVVFVTGDGRKLVKVPAEGGPRNDISFLARHDEAVYHPAGTHVAVVGEDADGNYGIFLATNEGKDVRQLVAVDAALEVYEPVFSHDGDTMYYVADHGGRWDLHNFSLSSTPDAATEGQLQTLSKHTRRIDSVRVSEFDGSRIAFRVGDCESGFSTFAHVDGDSFEAVTGAGDTAPVGWLPNGDLVVAEGIDPCGADPTFDLYRSRLDDQDLLVSGVQSPAVRAALPPPPDPPGAAPEVIA